MAVIVAVQLKDIRYLCIMAGEEKTLKNVIDGAMSALVPKFGQREARWMMRIVIENVKGYTPVDVIMHHDDVLSGFVIGKIAEAVSRLLDDEPVQYIFGNARFFGNTLIVSPATLIPRPETEELVDFIVRENTGADLRVLDVCTGSGCIAVSLARALKFPVVDAVDISGEALDVAKENAARLKVAVNFSKKDALKMVAPSRPVYDIIVSNPPYIAEHERACMSRNVLEHEPWLALFVPDDDPLRFYRAITDYASHALKVGGRLYFEINPLFAVRTKELLSGYGFDDIRLMADMQGRQRFIIAGKL